MYPMINRENVDFSSDTEVCNIGYWEGVLADKRPCRVEEWVFHGVLNATVFISLEGLENLSLKGIKEMLLKNNIIEIIDDDIYITEVEDINDNMFWSINIPLEENGNIFNKCLVDIRSFDI